MNKLLLFLSCMMLLLVGCSVNTTHDLVIVKSTGYGYSVDKPIACGGGIDGEMKYLTNLRGPEGQLVNYTRLPDCCYFRIYPSGNGYLSRWELNYEGLTQPIVLYINTFVKAPIRAPDGFALAER